MKDAIGLCLLVMLFGLIANPEGVGETFGLMVSAFNEAVIND